MLPGPTRIKSRGISLKTFATTFAFTAFLGSMAFGQMLELTNNAYAEEFGQAKIEIVENQIFGRAACNRFFGSITRTDGKVEIGPLATTRMTCPDQAKENRFLTSLQSANNITLANGQLQFWNGDQLLLAFHPMRHE